MKRLFRLSLTLFALYLIGCDQGPEEPTKQEGDFLWPMAVGNRWIGIKEYYDARGNSLGRERDTMKIVRRLEIEGETWYEFNDSALRTNRSDGVWSRIPESTGDEYAFLFAKYPTMPGDTFMTDRFLATDEMGRPGETITIWVQTLSTDSVLTVPLGDLRTHFYKTLLQIPPNTFSVNGFDTWGLAPGVGPVMTIGGPIGPGVPRGAVYYEWRLEDAVVL